MAFTLFCVIVVHRSCLAFIHGDAVANDVFVGVVCPAGCCAAQFDPLHNFFVIHFQCQEHMDNRAFFFHQVVQGFCLGDGTGKAVKYKSGCLGVCLHLVAEHADGNFIGHQLAL